MILQDDMTKPLQVSYYPTKIGAHRHSVSGDIMFLVCNVIL